MSAIAFFLERAGIATTGISLVRENTASLQPPRFLWVSFPLGRPLGMPGDAAFQHRVIRAALELLAESSGPLLRDFPEDAPDLADGAEPAFCALPMPAPPDESLILRIVAAVLSRNSHTQFGLLRYGEITE